MSVYGSLCVLHRTPIPILERELYILLHLEIVVADDGYRYFVVLRQGDRKVYVAEEVLEDDNACRTAAEQARG